MNLFTRIVCARGTRRGLSLLVLSLSLLLWPSAALAQAPNATAVSFGPVMSSFATVAANAPYRVCSITAIGVPCSTTGVSLFSDDNLTQSLPNPGAANSQGIISFFVATGFYEIQVTPMPGKTYVYYAPPSSGSGQQASFTSTTDPPSQTCTALVNYGTFATSITNKLYQCLNPWTLVGGGTYGPPVKSPHLNPWVLTGTQNQFLLAEYNLDSHTITLPTCSSATRQIISIDLLPNNNTTNTVTVDAGTLPIYDGSEPSPMGTAVALTAVNGIATFNCNAGGHELSWVLARPTTLANLGAYYVPAAGGSWLIPPGLDPTGATDNSAQINAYIATQLDGTFGSRLTVYLPPGKYYAPGLSNIYGVKFEGPGIILKSINQPESGLSTATQGLQMSTSYSYAHRLVFGQEYMSHWMAIAERNFSASQTIQSIAVTTGGS